MNIDLNEVFYEDLNENVVVDLDSGSCESSTKGVVPRVGMVFGSWEEVDECFVKYGKQEGYCVFRAAGTKSRNHTKDTSNGWRNYIWKCEYAGQPNNQRTIDGKRVCVGSKGVVVSSRKTKKC